MTKKVFRPKCVQSDRQMAFTSTGFVVPCCWIDSPGGRRDETLKQLDITVATIGDSRTGKSEMAEKMEGVLNMSLI